MTTKEELEALLASGPPGGGSTVTLSPIGVPAAVMGPDGQPAPFTARGVQPRFWDGDEWGPASLSSPEIAELQRMLAASGLIPKGAVYRNGVWDDVSRDAYRELLAYANGSGLSLDQSMQEWKRTAADAAPKPDPYLRPDPSSLAQTVKAALRSKLGREVTTAELPGLMQQLGSLDEQAYLVNTAAEQGAVDGAAVVQGMDAEASFEEHLDRIYRPEINRREGILDLSEQRTGVMGNILALDQYIAGWSR